MMGTEGLGGQLKRVLYDGSVNPEVIAMMGLISRTKSQRIPVYAYNYSCPTAKHQLILPYTQNTNRSKKGYGKSGATWKQEVLLYVGPEAIRKRDGW